MYSLPPLPASLLIYKSIPLIPRRSKPLFHMISLGNYDIDGYSCEYSILTYHRSRKDSTASLDFLHVAIPQASCLLSDNQGPCRLLISYPTE
jgi:hypothetical protein